MRNVIIALLASGALLLSATNALALISVSADAPISYSFDESALKDTSVSGYKLGLTLPFFVGLGFEDYKVKGKFDASLAGAKYEHKVTMYDLFLDLPFPILNLVVGAGAGTGKFSAPGTTLDFKDAGLAQYFVSVGLPFAGIFDVHLGYHRIGGKADEKTTGGHINLDATMYTVGLKVGF